MPVTDLFASSRRILRKLLGRSRHVALAASLIPLGTVGMQTAHAAPTVQLPPEFPATPFSMRITDMERVPGDAEGNAFRIEFEVLNWSQHTADGLMMAANNGSTITVGSTPHLAAASIDPDGRGGPAGGAHIGPGTFDATPIHSGFGRGDIPNMLNDWGVGALSQSFVQWDSFDLTRPNQPFAGRPLYQSSLLDSSLPVSFRVNRVPGYGVDSLGDSAFDGGPDPYTPATPGGGEPFAQDNAFDGFVINVDDWDEGEVFSLNWFMATLTTVSGGMPYGLYSAAQFGDQFAYGIMSLARLQPTVGSPAGSLPGPVFVGNVGFDQSNNSFYDAVYEIPNPAEFSAEFGAGLTAPFLNPSDNFFNLPINTSLVPEPSFITFVGGGLAGFTWVGGRKRNKQ
jgi:hypothetical protein